MQNLISVAELKALKNDPDLIILDATIPKVVKEGNTVATEKKYIEGARFFDLKKAFSNLDSSMPNTMPTAAQFEQAAQKLGISTKSKIVVYDDLGIYVSPRVWWMFKTMGHDQISVLDGGLPEWMNSGFETTSGVNQNNTKGDFKAHFNSAPVKDFSFIQNNMETKEALVIDARSSDRFNSLVPEPRADLRSGNITGSINIPYTDVLENGKYKSAVQLKVVFENLKSEDRPLVFSCGSGITACVVHLACATILENEQWIYDGSWTEYAQLTNG